MLLSDVVQDPSTQYIIRWPPWVGLLIAIAIMGAPYSALAAWVRRLWGSIGLIALVGLVALGFAAIIIGEWRREPRISGWDLVVAAGACIVGFAVAPAVTIWLKSRGPAPVSMAKQVGWGVLSIYGAFASMALLMVLVLIISSFVQG